MSTVVAPTNGLMMTHSGVLTADAVVVDGPQVASIVPSGPVASECRQVLAHLSVRL